MTTGTDTGAPKMLDMRAAAARFYDLQPSPFDGQDIPFYMARLPGPAARVLELGCGTGRVLLPLAARGAQMHGVDLSEAMIAICREKLAAQQIPTTRASVEVGDICRLDLGRRFDLILAPFRVMQNLETDAQVDGLFATVRRHLAPAGACILNAFRPLADEETLRRRWAERQRETVDYERPWGAGRLVAYESIRRVHPTQLIMYPRLTYRYYEGDALKDEASMDIVMRGYYPAEFVELMERHGFRIAQRWGGYAGEIYGEGSELVVQLVDAGSGRA